MAFPRRTHDPEAVLDYPMDWSDWLPEGDTITEVDVVAPAGITVGVTEIVGAVTVAWLSGGTAGQNYDVTYHVTTADGRQDDRSLTLVVKER